MHFDFIAGYKVSTVCPVKTLYYEVSAPIVSCILDFDISFIHI